MTVLTVRVDRVECSAADVTDCLQVLEPEAKSHTTFAAIKARLGASKNPLAEADFWQVVNDWRASHPGAGLTTKVVLITALKELLEAGPAEPPRTSQLPPDESSRSPADGAAGTDWTGAEVAATVDDYLAMLTAEAAGQQYSKTVHRRALRQRLSANCTDAAIEYKHQNISAVMIALGLPYIRGYKPMGNFQEALAAEIQRRLRADPALLGRLQSTPASTVPAAPLQRTDPPQCAARDQQRASAGGRAGRHRDYGLLQDENTKRGAAGEQLVVDYERTWLREHGRSDLADRVRWTAHDDGDGLGYDVLSYSSDGSKRYIEVKTTALGDLVPFYISSAELAFARQHLQSYALYRVYDVLASQPRFFALEGNDILQLQLTPVTYRACLPAQTPAGDGAGG